MITLAICCNKCWDTINAFSLVVRSNIILDVPFTGGHWTLSDIRQAAKFKNESGDIFEAESRNTSVVTESHDFFLHTLASSRSILAARYRVAWC